MNALFYFYDRHHEAIQKLVDALYRLSFITVTILALGMVCCTFMIVHLSFM
jgi:hypothetical protein